MTRRINRRDFFVRTSVLGASTAASIALPGGASRAARHREELAELSAVAAVTAMRNGDIKAEDYARALLDRAQRLEKLNAFISMDNQMVLESARAADKARASGTSTGMLHGLPIPVKDSVNTKALPTSLGTRALRNFRPDNDAEVLKSLFSQGGILMGKTNIHELTYGWTSNNGIFGPVRNPYDTTRIPGGSSGGSGAAVAARMAPLAIAEDTLGSIRVPATMCGLVGLRPSLGRYPGKGIMPLTKDSQFGRVGPVARSVRDVALFDSVVSGDMSRLDPTPLDGVRIGVSPKYFLTGLDSQVERITDAAFTKLTDAGATLVWSEIPEAVTAALGVAITLITYETRPSISAFLEEQKTGITFDRMLAQGSEGIQETFRAFALPPNRPTQEAYEAMLAQRKLLQQEIGRYFADTNISAMVFPPVLIPPPRIGEEEQVDIGGTKVPLYMAMARNTALGSSGNMASLILPAGLTPNGLPVGLEFAALPGNDRALLSLGLSLEGVLGSFPGPKV